MSERGDVSPVLVRVEDACKVANPAIGINRGYRLLQAGEWEGIRVGRRQLVYMPSVYRWIERQIAEGQHHGED